MDANERIDERRVVVDAPGQHREVVTETRHQREEESSISGGTIGIIAVLALVAIGIVIYIVTNRNANDAANRDASAQIARDQELQASAQQPAAQQAPIIIQQPAPIQQPPVIVQQPAMVADPGATIDDATMLELATKRLGEDPNLSLVVADINNGQASLSGTVSSTADKVRAQNIVKAVRGVKSVDNRLMVSNP